MFERLGSWSYRLRYLIILAWIAAGGWMALYAPSLAGAGSTDQASFLPADAPSAIAKVAHERAFPGSTSSSSATITLYRAGGLTAADLAFRDAYAAWTQSGRAPAELRAVVTGTETADSRPELKTLLRSADGSFEILVINLNVANAGDEAAFVVRLLRDGLAAQTPAGLEVHATGAAAISTDYLEAVRVGTDSTTQITIVLVILVLLAIYRAPLAALIPLVTIGGAFLVARGILGYLAAAGWQVSSTLETFVVVLVFGVGTDYAIFLISRFREEVAGGDWHDASRITVGRIGAVITASAGTVIVGMLAMGAGEFRMLSTIGPGLAIAVAVTLAAGLTLAPALLSVSGRYLFWPLHARRGQRAEPRGVFAWLAAAVSRRPGIVTAVLLVLLALPALYMPSVKTNFDVLTDLPPTADSRLGYEAIRVHLGEDKLVQSPVVVDLGHGNALAPASLARLHELLADLRGTAGIATTTSIITPDGDTTIPDGFRPSVTLADMADQMADDDGASGDAASLAGGEAEDGLNQALDYLGGLAVAFPDVAARTEMRAARGGLTDALELVEQARKASVLSTQLRTLAASITDPANLASAGGDDGSDSTLLSDYLAELAAAYPEVRGLAAYRDAVRAASDLEGEATIAAALDLADAFNRLAGHFDGRPDATFFPDSLSSTAAAKEQRAEAQRIFDALPGQLTALGEVFAARRDDIWIPTTLGGEDGRKLQDAIDAFVSAGGSATRFYITSSDDPYSGGAFASVARARTILADRAPSFGPSAAGHIGGAIAQFADVQDTLGRDFQKVGLITVIGILAVLVVLLRSMVAPLYLVGTVLVSYGSAVGISAYLFQGVLGHPGVSPYLPLILFVLLVALGSDYNIFLMARIREEAAGRSLRDGVRVASGYTGAVITSAGLVLAGTFASMMAAPGVMLFQIGSAVAIGVLIDTFVVRSILVPAITARLGDRVWWPSGGVLAAALERLPVPASVSTSVGVPSTSRARFAVALGLVLIVPITVAGALTWAFGAAPDNLSATRAAVVNLDQGASLPAPDGSLQTLALGADLAAALTAGDGEGFTWVATDEAAAAAALASGEYAAVLTVPADFSRTVAAIRSDPTGSAPRATLRIATGRNAGYALGVVARAVATAIGDAAARGVTASYVDDVLVSVTTARDALSAGASDASSLAGDGSALADDVSGTGAVAETVSSGLRELADATSDAADGAQELVDGTQLFADGTRDLASGADALAGGTREARDGARQLRSGASDLADGLATLKANTADLPDQAGQLADGAADLAAGATGVADGAALLADGLDQMAVQSTGMGAGAVALDDGAAALEQGARDLRDGADAAALGAADLAQGASDLSAGVDAYTGGVDLLAVNCAAMGGGPAVCAQLAGIAAGSADLRSGAAGLAAGAAGVNGGIGALASGMDGIVDGADGVHTGTSQLAANLPLLEAGIADSATGAADLAAGAADLAAGADQLASGVQLFAAGAPDLRDGIRQLSDGATALADGLDTFASGMGDLYDGADQLASGAGEAASGAQELADGAVTAADGMGQMNDAMTTAADSAELVETQVNNLAEGGDALAGQADDLAAGLSGSADHLGAYDEQTREQVAALAADPVALDAQRLTVADATGALAPSFLALAAWLGALAAFLVVPAVWPGSRRWWLAAGRSYAIAATVTSVGVLLVAPLLDPLLGMSVANLPALVLICALAALAFTAIVQALVALLGTRGWLAALLLLVLGVATSGLGLGSAALPGPLAAIRPLLPTSYAIDALRAAISGSGSFLFEAMVLAAVLIVAAMVTLAAAAAAARRADEAAEPLGA